VEINAGQHSLVRQFLSGLTNQRGDEWGETACCSPAGARGRPAPVGDAIVGLRLSCDELAPWAGITPDMAVDLAAAAGRTRRLPGRGARLHLLGGEDPPRLPRAHRLQHRPLPRRIREAAPGTPVFLQGSVVDPGQAEWALGDGVCDAVEMTRAQLADPDLVAKLRAGHAATVRPCIRCNQTCQVRDARNPMVTCVGEPTTGRETEDPDWYTPTGRPRDVTWSAAACRRPRDRSRRRARGHRVRVVERRPLGGIAALAGPGGAVRRVAGRASAPRRACTIELAPTALQCRPDGAAVVQAPAGSRARASTRSPTTRRARRRRRAARRRAPPTGPSHCSTPSAARSPSRSPRSSAAAPSSSPRTRSPATSSPQRRPRPRQRAPRSSRACRSRSAALLREVRPGEIELEDRFSGERRIVRVRALVDCGFRLPTDPLAGAIAQAGDCVAPRTILEAILEARRAALAL
jgi:hypothetical protein